MVDPEWRGISDVNNKYRVEQGCMDDLNGASCKVGITLEDEKWRYLFDMSSFFSNSGDVVDRALHVSHIIFSFLPLQS